MIGEKILLIPIITSLGLSFDSATSRRKDFNQICKDAVVLFSTNDELIEYVKVNSYINNIDYLSFRDIYDDNSLLNYIYSVTDIGNRDSNYIDITVYTASTKVIYAKQYVGSGTPNDFNNYQTSYPTSNRVAQASKYYNCHYLAWYKDGQYQNVNESSAIWFSEAEAFTSNYPYCSTTIQSSFVPSTNSNYASLIQTGDIIVYYYVHLNEGGELNHSSHSAVVTSTSSSFSNITVVSKWGEGGVYTHNILDCPYYHTQVGIYSETPIAIYRPAHSYQYSQLNALRHQCTSYCCGRIHAEPHHFTPYGNFQVVCSECGYITYSPYFLS